MSEEPQFPKTHNLPPYVIPIPDDVHAKLASTYDATIARSAELIKEAKDTPEEIKTEEQAKALADLIKQIRVYCKATEGTRTIETEPWNAGKKAVDGFFNGLTDPLNERIEGWKDKLTVRQKKFLDWKEEEKRKAREAEAAAAREREAEALRKAEEAEARRRDADRLAAEALEEIRKAEIRKETALREAREAEDRRRHAQEQERLAEQRRRDAEAAARRQEKTNAVAAVVAAIVAAEETTKARIARDRREEEDRKATEARQRAGVANAEARAGGIQVRAHEKDSRAAVREESSALRVADTLDRDASVLEGQAKAKPAELARTQSEYGTTATLAEVWDYTILDRSAIPLERLRKYINPDAIDVAVGHYMRAGERNLPGVSFFQRTAARII